MSSEWKGALTGNMSTRFAPRAFSRRARALDRLAMAGNDGLIRRVEIHRLDHLPLRRFTAGILDRGGLQAHDRRHRANAGRHGLLHRLRTKAHERQRLGEGKRACGDERGVFAQAVTGEQIGRSAAGGAPGAVDRHIGGQHERLRIDRLVERFAIAVLDQRPEILPQRRGGFGECVAHHRIALVATHHARGLRSLTGKNQGQFHRFTIAAVPIPR